VVFFDGLNNEDRRKRLKIAVVLLIVIASVPILPHSPSLVRTTNHIAPILS